MSKLFPACTLALALTFGLAVSARAAESAPAPDPVKTQQPQAAPAASPDTQAATPAPTAPAALTLPEKPGSDGAQIGTPAPLAMTCPGIVWCRDFCTENGGPNCVSVYKCFVNGTWTCNCFGPGGGPCL